MYCFHYENAYEIMQNIYRAKISPLCVPRGPGTGMPTLVWSSWMGLDPGFWVLALTLRQTSSGLPRLFSCVFFLTELKPYFLKIWTSFDVYFPVMCQELKTSQRLSETGCVTVREQVIFAFSIPFVLFAWVLDLRPSLPFHLSCVQLLRVMSCAWVTVYIPFIYSQEGRVILRHK